MMKVCNDDRSYEGVQQHVGWCSSLRLGVSVVSLLLALGLGATDALADAPVAKPPTETPPVVELTVKDKMISAKVVKAPLRQVLAELAHQAKLTFLIAPSDAERTVTAKFESLSMVEGMKLLLEGQNFAMITEPILGADGQPSGTRVSQIRILSEGEAYTTITGRLEDPLAQLKRDVAQAADAKERRAALQALEAQRDKMSKAELAAVVVPAMEDESPAVRAVALSLVHTVVGWQDGLIDHLGHMAQRDPHPRLRSKALWYLFGVDEKTSESYLRQALNDPDARVKKQAARLLQQVEEIRREEEAAASNAGTKENKTQPPTSPTTQPQ